MAVKSKKKIILAHTNGVNVGAVLKTLPSDVAHVSAITSIPIIDSAPQFRKLSVEQILEAASDMPDIASLSLGKSGSVRLMSVKTPGKCMHLMSGESRGIKNGDGLHLWDLEPGHFPAQEFIMDQRPGGTMLLRSAKAPGKCV